MRSTLRRNRRAAYFIPTSVSAAGYAHWPGTPATTSVRVPSVSAGTVESAASTSQRPSVSRPCSSTSRRSSGSCSKPRLKPVAQMTCSAPFDLGADPEAALALAALDRLVPRAARRVRGRAEAARAAPRAAAGRRRAEARPGRASRRAAAARSAAGARARAGGPTTTSAPAASAFSHSVAAAMPAPTTATRSAYSCGS